MKVSRYYIILILELSDFNFRVSNEMFFFFLKSSIFKGRVLKLMLISSIQSLWNSVYDF